MEVRIVHVGHEHWLVQEEGDAKAPIYRFDPAAPHTLLGVAAGRSYVAFGDLIAVDEVDLKERVQ